MSTSRAPRGLKAAGKALRSAGADAYELAEHEDMLLTEEDRHLDRAAEARRLVDREGITVTDAYVR